MKQKDNFRELDDYIRSMNNMLDPLSGDTRKIRPVDGEANRVWEAFQSEAIVGFDEDMRNALQEPGQVNVPYVRQQYRAAMDKAKATLVHELEQRGYRFGNRQFTEPNEQLRAAELPYMIADNVQTQLDRFYKMYGAEAKPAWVYYTKETPKSDGRTEEVSRTANLTGNFRQEIWNLANNPSVKRIDGVMGARFPISMNRLNVDFELVKASSEEEAIQILEDTLSWKSYTSEGPFNAHEFAVGYDKERAIPMGKIAVEAPSDTYVLQINSHYLSNGVVAANNELDAIQRAKHHFGVQTDPEVDFELDRPVEIQMEHERLLRREIIPTVRKINEQAREGIHFTDINELSDRDRITDVSIMKGSAGKQFIRCKVDGEQQMALPVKMMDRMALATGKVTKEDLAVKYFHDELSRDRSQEQDRGMKR